MKLDPFYLIVDSAEWIERLVPIGVKLVQLRVKNQPEAVLRQQIRAAKLACEMAGCQLIVNDYWELAIEEGCDFIHLGQEDLAAANLSAIRGAKLKLGVSTHNEAELDNALTIRPDYIALGPIYPTVLKVMPWAPQGIGRIMEWKKRIADIPLVAIGGLTVELIAGVMASGADSAAVVTDITRNVDPEGRCAEWIRSTRSYINGIVV